MPAASPFPEFTKLLPMLVDERAFDLNQPDWVYELKYDGYRCLALVDGDTVGLRGKTGSNMTAWFPEVCKGLAGLRGGQHIIDGEVCVLDDLGRNDFDRFHDRPCGGAGTQALPRWCSVL